MDNIDDSETNAKISDSAYSNSCSNSQSRRSHSSKSTHSSGSSGYGGKPKGSYSDNSGQLGRSKDKDGKKKKQTDIVASETQPEITNTEEKAIPVAETIIEEADNIEEVPPLDNVEAEKGSEVMDISIPEVNSTEDEVKLCNNQLFSASDFVSNCSTGSTGNDGFSCVISMQDGVVMYTTSDLTGTLGFPKDMWIGRSFIDFVHPRDRNIFASHITTGFGLPKNVNGTQEEVLTTPQNTVCTMVCRIRKHRNLAIAFGVKEQMVAFMPFLLTLTLKNISKAEDKATYLVIQASPFYSAFKIPFEKIQDPVPFVIRHTATGNLEYLDPESVPYLGFLPQDLADKDAIQLYHPDDLCYLRQVYEVIVREGTMARSKCFRLMTQNGDFVKVETEWASFTNPWSRKLEFVIGKHHILEGPANPDVFQPPTAEKLKMPEEEKKRIQALRDSIIRILSEVLTKPAEAAKQQMTKRCQDLAAFMESLIEDTPKVDEELRLELNETDHSYFERDTVMLGGISPHHDYNDSKASTETPLSYNQLNYNENLQRYFDSHEPYPINEKTLSSEENAIGFKNRSAERHMFRTSHNSGDSGEISSSESTGMSGENSSSAHYGDYVPPRLTESVISKHNSYMEKDLMKAHRETRTSSKGERVKVVKETRQKKKEHLARCNAAYQPTSASHTTLVEAHGKRQHGVKRSSRGQQEGASSQKHHCSTSRQSRRRQTATVTSVPVTVSTVTTSTVTTSTVTTTTAPNWPTTSTNGMNTFFLGVGIPQQMPMMSPMAGPIPGQMPDNVPYMSGVIPMYYAPAAAIPPGMPNPTNMNPPGPTPSGSQQFPQPAMPCMMYGQPVYGQPFMYSPISHQITFPMQPNMITQATLQVNESTRPLGLANSNYEQACKSSFPMDHNHVSGNSWRDKRLNKKLRKSSNTGSTSSSNRIDRVLNWKCDDSYSYNHSDSLSSGEPSTLNSFSFQSIEADPEAGKNHGSEETVYRTDGESSYSSFYSSFFKTDSGSADDSGDAKKTTKENQLQSGLCTSNTYYEPPKTKKIPRRKMEPPWMEQVCVTSELVYKYQITTKNMEEVLEADKIKMNTLVQPPLVNEQLEQLYLDLQLEGVASRLTLEEGMTSSSSSGDEGPSNRTPPPKVKRKKEYSKLVMIYEEDAPLPPPPPPPEQISPPPPEQLSPVPGTSKSLL